MGDAKDGPPRLDRAGLLRAAHRPALPLVAPGGDAGLRLPALRRKASVLPLTSPREVGWTMAGITMIGGALLWLLPGVVARGTAAPGETGGLAALGAIGLGLGAFGIRRAFEDHLLLDHQNREVRHLAYAALGAAVETRVVGYDELAGVGVRVTEHQGEGRRFLLYQTVSWTHSGATHPLGDESSEASLIQDRTARIADHLGIPLECRPSLAAPQRLFPEAVWVEGARDRRRRGLLLRAKARILEHRGRLVELRFRLREADGTPIRTTLDAFRDPEGGTWVRRSLTVVQDDASLTDLWAFVPFRALPGPPARSPWPIEIRVELEARDGSAPPEALRLVVAVDADPADWAAPPPEPQGGLRFVEGAVPGAPGWCGVCADPLGPDGQSCPDCGAAQHRDCWEFAARCATYACGGRPPLSGP